MLGLGWTEMLVIGVVALIVIGPKDLPVVMNRIGKFAGQIRRMGSEFQREINKTTGLDEVRNLRNSITAPLKQSADEIRKEFNAMTPTGQKPTGVLKQTDPQVESVVDDIHAKAGMTAPTPEPVVTAGAEAVAPTANPPKAAKPKAPVKAKAAPTRPVITTELPPIATEEAPKPAKKAPARKAPAKAETAVAVEPVAAAAKKQAAAKKPAAPRKAPTKTAAKAESE